MKEASEAVIPYVNSRLWLSKSKGDEIQASTSLGEPRSCQGEASSVCLVDRARVVMKEHTERSWL